MNQSACTREVTVNLKDGLHLRPALQIAQLAQTFKCDIQIRKGDRHADAKSNMDLLTLFAEQGTVLTLEARGDDATDAINSLAKLFESDFSLESPSAN